MRASFLRPSGRFFITFSCWAASPSSFSGLRGGCSPPLSRERPRGNEAAGWAGFVLLNAGMLLRAVAEPALALEPRPWARVLLILSAAALVLAGWVFAGLLWPRVKPRPGKEG